MFNIPEDSAATHPQVSHAINFLPFYDCYPTFHPLYTPPYSYHTIRSSQYRRATESTHHKIPQQHSIKFQPFGHNLFQHPYNTKLRHHQSYQFIDPQHRSPLSGETNPLSQQRRGDEHQHPAPPFMEPKNSFENSILLCVDGGSYLLLLK
jgi:hypothetical protein